MATKKNEEPIKPQPIGGAMGGTLGSNLQLGGFGNPMGFTPPTSRPVFGASAQQSSQDFSRLQMPTMPNIPLGNTVPVFPDNYNSVMGERMRAPSSMVSGIREGDLSGFSPYSQTVPSMGGLTQTPSMAPATNAITSFGNPMASRTEGIATPYGTASTTLNPEQQAFRFQARQQAQESGTMPRTPQQQQELLAQMREKGGVIGKRLAGEEASRQKDLQRGYYSFRQGLEQDRFQNAMSQVQKSQARGESGRDAMRIAEQARYGGEIMRQAGANVGTERRTPFFGEVASMPSGEQFYRGSMGEYSRVVGTGKQLGGVRGGPQPTQAQPMTMAPQFGRANTSQRSWDNYVGPNPIRSFSYSGGY